MVEASLVEKHWFWACWLHVATVVAALGISSCGTGLLVVTHRPL